MQYLITTKAADGPKLGSLQPSRDEAAEFWRDLMEATTDAEDLPLSHILDLMGDQERAQEGDSHSHPERRVYTLEAEGGGFPQLMWGEGIGDSARESRDLELTHYEEHRALCRQAELA